jgi:hypothetical protein
VTLTDVETVVRIVAQIKKWLMDFSSSLRSSR